MKKNSLNQQLPALGLPSTRKHSESRDSVKLIQTKITQHETSIERNQKFIISIANDFRLVKQQLAVKQKQNEQLSQMYRKSVDENQKILKSTKQWKQTITRLQKKIEQKDRTIQKLKTNQVDKQALKQQQQIQGLKQKIAVMEREQRIKQKTNYDLIKQLEKCKQDINKLKKTNKQYQQNLNKHMNNQQKIKRLENIIDNLNVQKDKLIREVKQKQEDVRKLRDKDKEKDKIVRDYHRMEEDVKLLRANYDKLVEDHRKRKDKISQLQQTIRCQQQQLSQQQSSQSQISQLVQAQQSLQSSLSSLKQKQKQQSDQLRALTAQLQQKKKLQIKYKKILKSKIDLQKIAEKIQKIIKCEYCQKLLVNPVTCIPCGHSFCLDCKKGYQKECKKCVGGVKRQAVYRNQLLDEVGVGVACIGDVLNILAALQ